MDWIARALWWLEEVTGGATAIRVYSIDHKGEPHTVITRDNPVGALLVDPYARYVSFIIVQLIILLWIQNGSGEKILELVL